MNCRFRAGDIGALKEDVVAEVAHNEQPAEGSHDVGAVPDEIEKLMLQSFPNPQFGARNTSRYSVSIGSNT